MPFDFSHCVTRYMEAASKGKYPREKSWDSIWDYFQPFVATREARASLLREDRLEVTALHIGFYLASWGMFRGRGALLRQNLDFFKNLAVYLLRQPPEGFWSLQFDCFREDRQAVQLFNEVRKALGDFVSRETGQGDSNLIVGKLLLGVWGQCPAVDENVRTGIVAPRSRWP